MTDSVIETHKTPGIVIFVAVLNFLASFFLSLFAVLCLVLILFGNAAAFYDAVTKQINQVYGQYNLSMGLNVLFGILLAGGLAFAVFYLLIGIGLLKGKKLAWYFQIALSVLGLLGFPVGTIINTVILILFFQSNVRSHFRV